MSRQPDLAPQATSTANDDLSRRRLVTGAAVVAALGGATAEALAQGAPGSTRETCAFSIRRPASRTRASITRSRRPGRSASSTLPASRAATSTTRSSARRAISGRRRSRRSSISRARWARPVAASSMSLKLCHYFIDLQAHFRMMRDIRLKYFDPARMPASTMIQVGALTDAKAIYEVDVVAVLPPA